MTGMCGRSFTGSVEPTARMTMPTAGVPAYVAPKSWSTVKMHSKCGAARSISAPFLTPAQPICCTVWISKPLRSCLSCLGTHSSRRTRVGNEQVLGVLERSDGLSASNGRKIGQELVQRVATLDVVHQGLKRNPRTYEYGLPSQH